MKDFLLRTYREFTRDHGPRLAAALAYYALFAIAPALVVAVALAGVVLGQTTVSTLLTDALTNFLGADLTATLVDLAQSRSAASYYDTAWIAVVILLITSALALNQLQAAFNRMWLLDLKPGVPIWRVVRTRLAQALIALLPAALLVVGTVSNSIAAAISARPYLERVAGLAETFGSPIAVIMSSAVAFSIVFKYLPDGIVPWRPALISAGLTSVAWFVGTYLFGLYVGRTAMASAYGAAGSVFVLLIWLNYSARIVLIGCKVSKLLVERKKGDVTPRDYAVRVIYQTLEEPTPGLVRTHDE